MPKVLLHVLWQLDSTHELSCTLKLFLWVVPNSERQAHETCQSWDFHMLQKSIAFLWRFFWMVWRKEGPQTYNNMMMGPSGFWIAQRKEGPQRIYIYMMGSKLIGWLIRGWYEGKKVPQTNIYDDGSKWCLDSTKERRPPTYIYIYDGVQANWMTNTWMVWRKEGPPNEYIWWWVQVVFG
jgi:hypothetical protein